MLSTSRQVPHDSTPDTARPAIVLKRLEARQTYQHWARAPSGGGGGNRTPVRNPSGPGVYEHSPYYVSRLAPP